LKESSKDRRLLSGPLETGERGDSLGVESGKRKLFSITAIRFFVAGEEPRAGKAKRASHQRAE